MPAFASFFLPRSLSSAPSFQSLCPSRCSLDSSSVHTKVNVNVANQINPLRIPVPNSAAPSSASVMPNPNTVLNLDIDEPFLLPSKPETVTVEPTSTSSSTSTLLSITMTAISPTCSTAPSTTSTTPSTSKEAPPLRRAKTLRESRRGWRLTFADLQAEAHARGGQLLSTHYSNAHQLLHWRCKEGHEWFASGCNVRNAKAWCPHCAKKRRRSTIEDMQRLASRFGGRCLSTEYRSKYIKLQWQCAKGHTFWIAPENVNRSPNGARKPSWCKICAKEQRQQAKKTK